MPSWDVHIKWAVRLGVNRDVADLVNRLIDAPDAVLINDPSELGERYRKDPEAIKQLLNIEHDWGRKGGKAQLEMLRSYCYDRFGFEGVLAAELHHMLDYIAHVWKPENPFHSIVELLCSEGFAILAFSRYTFHSIVELPILTSWISCSLK